MPVVPILHESAEAATQEVRLHLENLNPPASPSDDLSYHAHAIRFFLNRALKARGQDARIDKQWLANSGVAFRLDWIDARMLKSLNGALPPPGESRAKRAYYRQELDFMIPMWESEAVTRTRASVNVVFTWDIDYRGNLLQLKVYCPSRGESTPNSVGSFWSEVLVHPALTYEPTPPSGTPGSDLFGYERKAPSEEKNKKAQ